MANKPDLPVSTVEAAPARAHKKSSADYAKEIAGVAKAHQNLKAEKFADMARSELELHLLALYLLSGEDGGALTREERELLRAVPEPE